MTASLKLNKEKFFKYMSYEPHESQWKYHNSKARFRTLAWGRRGGKTKAAAMEALYKGIAHPNRLIWIVAPSYELSNKVFREIYWALNKKLPFLITSCSMSKQLQEIKLKTNTTIMGKSAENPTSLLGEGVDDLFMDECARIKQIVYEEALRPTLTDKQGSATFISTPKGKNWFHELFKKGKNPDLRDYESWQFPTSNNPYIIKEELEQARESLPRLIYQQEYEAEFLSEEDQFFSQELIEDCIDETIQKLDSPHPKKEYFLGVDFARMGQDSSVFIVAEKQWPNGQDIKIIDIIETKHKLLTEAVGRIKALHKKYQFRRIYLDETGLGAGPSDQLKEELKATVVPITFTNKNKTDLYMNLKLLMEKQKIKFPNVEKLIYQLTDLRYEYSSEGNLKLHHSDRGFDDYPDSLALAVWFAHGVGNYTPLIA